MTFRRWKSARQGRSRTPRGRARGCRAPRPWILEALWFLVPALALALLLFAPGPHTAKKNKKNLHTIQVREAEVREAPSYLAPVAFRAAYTSRVRVVEESGPWRLVEVPDRDLTGWLLESALTEKQIVLEAPNKKTAKKLAQKKEQSLAGRSFQDEVEKKLKQKKKKDLAEGYTRLDRVVAATDSLTLSPGQLALFRAEGGLTPLTDPGGQPVLVGSRPHDESAREIGP